MKNCVAGHELVLFSGARCPVCATIERLDKQLLQADCEIARLQERVGWLEAGYEATSGRVDAKSEEFREWNGGAC